MGVITKVMVTGCAGFIGSNLVEALLDRGFDVAGMDDLSTGRPDNMRGLDFEFVKGTINDRESLLRALSGADYVFHHAAIASVPRSIEDPMESNHANIDGTLNLLLCARDAGVKRVVFAGSSSIYGNRPQLPKKEDMVPDPISPYALTKYVGEKYCVLFNSFFGLETIILRYFNVFGPRQDPDSEYAAVIPRFIGLMLEGKKPTIYGDGSQSRDFSFVTDVIEANLLAIKAPKGACGKAFNIASNERKTLLQLIDEINGILGTDLKPKHAAEREGDVKHSYADISLAKEYLGYRPAVLFREGLARTIEWFRRS